MKRPKRLRYKVNVVLFGLICLLSILFGLMYKTEKSKYTDVEVQVTSLKSMGQYSTQLSTVPYWLIEAIKVGDRDISASGGVNAEVKDVISYDEGNAKVAFLKLSLKTTTDKFGRLKYKDRFLTVGSLLELNLNKASLAGYISSINTNDETSNYVYKKVTIRMYDRYNWFGDSLVVGDRVVDSKDLLQSEILSKKTEVAKRSVGDMSGNLFVRNDPLVNDFVVDLKLRLVNKAGIFYFANYQPVKIGNRLWIPFNKYNLYDAEVIAIDEIN